jgi:hypothetical protein
MARLNEILVARYSRSLQKLFGIKGPVPVATLAPEIMPVHPIEVGVESRYLDGWNRFMAPALVAAAATFNAVTRFRNPAGSNVIAVLERVQVQNSVASQPRVEIRTVNTDLATPTSMANARLDVRGNATPTLIQSVQNNSVFTLTSTMWVFVLTANVSSGDLIIDTNGEIALLPGDSLTIVESVVNVALNAQVLWRERFLEDSERA